MVPSKRTVISLGSVVVITTFQAYMAPQRGFCGIDGAQSIKIHRAIVDEHLVVMHLPFVGQGCPVCGINSRRYFHFGVHDKLEGADFLLPLLNKIIRVPAVDQLSILPCRDQEAADFIARIDRPIVLCLDAGCHNRYQHHNKHRKHSLFHCYHPLYESSALTMAS